MTDKKAVRECTLKKAYREISYILVRRIREIKQKRLFNQDIRGRLVERSIDQIMKIIETLRPTHITLDMCSFCPTRGQKRVGYAKKSVWWMPRH
jgi:hypothetical protein